jgi:hypothetical protein
LGIVHPAASPLQLTHSSLYHFLLGIHTSRLDLDPRPTIRDLYHHNPRTDKEIPKLLRAVESVTISICAQEQRNKEKYS